MDSIMEPNSIILHLLVGTYQNQDLPSVFQIKLELPSGRVLSYQGSKAGSNPSFLSLTPDKRFLFAVHETTDFDAAGHGAVSLLEQGLDGNWQTKQMLSSAGKLPAHCVIVPETNTLLVANYESGSVALFPFVSETLQEAADVFQLQGHGQDPIRQSGPHAHQIVLSPDRKFFFVVDLGSDCVLTFSTAALLNNRFQQVATFHMHPGWGPRHMAFHPDGTHAYLVHELSCMVSLLTYDPANGTFRELAASHAIPEDFTAEKKSAGLTVSKDGRFLYVSNRGYDSIAVFAIDPNSKLLTLVQQQRTGICWPREFTISPCRNYLIVANKKSDSLQLFHRDKRSGLLSDTSISIPVSIPAFVKCL